jgi:hypothetical protein
VEKEGSWQAIRSSCALTNPGVHIGVLYSTVARTGAAATGCRAGIWIVAKGTLHVVDAGVQGGEIACHVSLEVDRGNAKRCATKLSVVT